MPRQERPIERTLARGTASLSDAELLALLLRTGTKDLSAVALAAELMQGLPGGLRDLARLSPKELMGRKGIGRTKACAVAAAAEVGKRIYAGQTAMRTSVTDAQKAAALFMPDLRYAEKEYFCCAFLDTKAHLIDQREISIGALSGAPVHPREVFSPAIRLAAASLILAHNHPSGDPSPSEEDVRVTRRLREAGDLLGIRVLDHIIIGDGTFTSLLQAGLL